MPLVQESDFENLCCMGHSLSNTGRLDYQPTCTGARPIHRICDFFSPSIKDSLAEVCEKAEEGPGARRMCFMVYYMVH